MSKPTSDSRPSGMWSPVASADPTQQSWEEPKRKQAMAETPDRRSVARLTVPRNLRGPELELHLVHLLDLSALGARIEALEPLREGGVCYVELPTALGSVRLTGRIVWTAVRGSEQTLEGDRRLHYQSGLTFTGLTPEQQTALAGALDMLQAEWDSQERISSRGLSAA